MNRIRVIKRGDNYGLCNRLFPFAHLIASALEFGWLVENEGFSEFAEFFEGTRNTVIPCFPSKHLTKNPRCGLLRRRVYNYCRRLMGKCGFESRIVLSDDDLCDLASPAVHAQLGRNRTTQCIGLYFYNIAAVMKHAQAIREYFRPVPTIATMVRKVTDQARNQGNLVVGVHIRHGDYAEFCNGIMFYSFEEYASLMRLVRDNVFPEKKIAFLVASNAEIPHSVFREFDYSVAPGHFVSDVYALAACDYIIGPPSTFSEWASFYGQVPRYVHYANDYKSQGKPWPGIRKEDFLIHLAGFARINPNHPATLILDSHID